MDGRAPAEPAWTDALRGVVHEELDCDCSTAMDLDCDVRAIESIRFLLARADRKTRSNLIPSVRPFRRD